MDRWYSRYRRGDVWFLHFDNETGDGSKTSSVQKKSRPYLIVSCEENNLNAPTFNVVPLTTRDSDHLPMHVYFRYMDGPEGGRNQLILCEQITTVSVEVFLTAKSKFMYSLSIELMNKVDEALTRQLGLKPRVADMHILERIVNELAETEAKRIEAQKEKEVNMRVEALAAMLIKKFNLNLDTTALLNGTEYRDAEMQYADKADVQTMRETAAERRKPSKSELQEVCDEVGITKTQFFAEAYGKAEPVHLEQAREVAKRKLEEKTKPVEEKPKKRHKWSLEEKKQFLADYATMTVAQMSKKYGIKKSSVTYNVCVFRKEVGNNDSGAAI